MTECSSSNWGIELVTESVSDCDSSASGWFVVVSGCWCSSTDAMCKCLGVYGLSVSLSDSYLVLHLYGWGMLHLFLQLLAFTGHDCLSSWSLLGDLICHTVLKKGDLNWWSWTKKEGIPNNGPGKVGFFTKLKMGILKWLLFHTSIVLNRGHFPQWSCNDWLSTQGEFLRWVL